jgi:hypothetical protein
VESYERLGQPAMKLLHALGDEAAGPGGVDGASLAGAQSKLCVGLCRGIFLLCMFGNACKVLWDGVPGWHASAHRRALIALKFLFVIVCLPMPVISM